MKTKQIKSNQISAMFFLLNILCGFMTPTPVSLLKCRNQKCIYLFSKQMQKVKVVDVAAAAAVAVAVAAWT